METVSTNACFGGTQGVYSHASDACNCDMTFAVYTPPQAERGPVPVLWYLSGLTCTHANAMEKAGAQRVAAEHGVAVVFPDTSPRGDDVAEKTQKRLAGHHARQGVARGLAEVAQGAHPGIAEGRPR